MPSELPATHRETQQVGIPVCTLLFYSSSLTSHLPDARFEILGSPYSLLSVTLSASQKLYTRRGTLVAMAGNAENVCEADSLNHTLMEPTC